MGQKKRPPGKGGAHLLIYIFPGNVTVEIVNIYAGVCTGSGSGTVLGSGSVLSPMLLRYNLLK